MTDGYPSDWNSRRKKVYERDNYTCQNCGVRGGPHGNVELHAHHIVPKSKGGRHHPSNLTTVCADCHNAIHNETHAPTASTTQDPEYVKYMETAADSEGITAAIIKKSPEEVGGSHLYYNKEYVRQYNHCLKMLKSTVRFYYQFQKLPDTSSNSNQHTDYEKFIEKFEDEFSEIEEQANRLRSTQTRNHLSETSTIRDNLIDEIKVVDEWKDIAAQLVSTRSRPRSSEHNLLSAEGDGVKEEVESVLEVGVKFLNQMKEEESEQMSAVRRTRTNVKADQLDVCPFCTSPLQKVADDLIQCGHCHAEFIGDGAEWELIHGNDDFLNTSLIPELWEYVADVGFDDLEYSVSDLEERSNKYTALRGKLLVAVIAVGIPTVLIAGEVSLGSMALLLLITAVVAIFITASKQIPQA